MTVLEKRQQKPSSVILQKTSLLFFNKSIMFFFPNALSAINPTLRSLIVEGATSGQIEYVCETDQVHKLISDPVWRIKKLIYSGSFLVQVIWADGNAEFNKAATDPTAFTYTTT